MSEPFIGEIRMFAGNFAPLGWAFCDGQLIPISENDALFALIGTTYGGDGQTTFALPDLRGRAPIHQGSGYTLAQMTGSENVTLNSSQIPNHTHTLMARERSAAFRNPIGAQFAVTEKPAYAAPGGAGLDVLPGAIASAGGSQPHENMQPFLCVRFIIALFGIFPSRP